MRRAGRGGDNWSCQHEFIAARIHPQIHSRQGAETKPEHIIRSRKKNFINRLPVADAEDAKTHRPFDDAPVGHLDLQIMLHRLNADRAQGRRGNPSECTPAVHEKLGNDRRPSRVCVVLDFAADIEEAHTLGSPQPPPTRAASFEFSVNARSIASSPVRPSARAFFSDCSTRL